MPTPQLPEYMRISKYAQYVQEYGRRETWSEQVGRVFDMHYAKFERRLEVIRHLVAFSRNMMLDRRVLGSQRALQFGGVPALRHNARIYNCTVSFCDRPRFFQECLYLLLCGCGTGFSVQKHHVAKLPELTGRRGPAMKYVVPDSIEGWADSVGVLVSSFMDGEVPFPEFRGRRVEFDFSNVRPKGAPISSGSKAPGPEPLADALSKMEDVFELALELEGKLRPIDAYDICMHASNAVLAGGVRRSASIALFSHDDDEMMKAKTGNWYRDNKQRSRSNNSAVMVRGETTFQEFAKLIEFTKQYGEPGFMWTDSTEMVINPCGEIGMWPVLVDAEGRHHSGWQFCNLSEINASVITSKEEFLEACVAASVLGTLQAGYTDFEYMGPVTEQIVRNESLIGVGITGMMEAPELMFDPDVLEAGARKVAETNELVANAIGIKTAARMTCIKPSGNGGAFLDTLCPGIHAAKSAMGIKHVQASSIENPLVHFKKFNPQAVMECVWDDTGMSETIAFPYFTKPGTIVQADLTAVQMLEKVILVRKHWVEPGTRPDRCSQPWLRHNVSNTVHIKDNEWIGVTHFIYENRAFFAGIAMLPEKGDKVFEQAPYMSVRSLEQLYKDFGDESYVDAQILIEELPDGTSLWEACDHVCALNGTLRMDGANWVRNFVGFVDEHFQGDVKRGCLCLKEVYAHDLYEHLMSTMVEVDWTTMREHDDEIDFGLEQACAGGMCSISIGT